MIPITWEDVAKIMGWNPVVTESEARREPTGLSARVMLVAKAAANAEREACANVCENLPRRVRSEFDSVSAECAAAIRARGE